MLADLVYPRFFTWSFGGLTLLDFPWLSQAADLVGAWGLGIFVAGMQTFVFLLLTLVYMQMAMSHDH